MMAIWLLEDGGVFPRALFASACELPGEAGRFDMICGGTRQTKYRT